MPLAVTVVAVVGAVAIAFVLLEQAVAPTVLAFGEVAVNRIAQETASKALHGGIGRILSYRELIHLETDPSGRVMFMQPNTPAIARTAELLTQVAQRELANLASDRIEIPLGHVLGSRVLANYGPRLPVLMTPVGWARVGIRDEFSTQGINQTRHVILADLEVTVRIVIPLFQEQVTVQVSHPIAEGVIVGEVPATYVRFDVEGPLVAPLPAAPSPP